MLAWFPGTGEWFLILLIALLIFGSRLPKVMRSLGQSVVEFKRGMRDIEEDVKKDLESKGDEHKDAPKPSSGPMAG